VILVYDGLSLRPHDFCYCPREFDSVAVIGVVHPADHTEKEATPAVESFISGRWVAIRKGNRTVYAQWEDAGPFRTDYWQYVFGNERRKTTLNKGAGLDVCPAVRDYLGLNETDVTDWRFVEFSEVPRGPWSTLGENNTFVINDRKTSRELAKASNRAEDRAITP
jgi:hypothetical protein